MGKILKLKGLHLQSSILGFIVGAYKMLYTSPNLNGVAYTGAHSNVFSYNEDGVIGTYANFARVYISATSLVITSMAVGKLNKGTGTVTQLATKSPSQEDFTKGYIDIPFTTTKFDDTNILVVGCRFNNEQGEAVATPIKFGSFTGSICHYLEDGAEIVHKNYAIGYDYGMK